MPIMSGFDLIDELAKKFPEEIQKVKIPLLSSTIYGEDAKRAKQNPLVLEMLSKPLDAQYLKNQLKDPK